MSNFKSNLKYRYKSLRTYFCKAPSINAIDLILIVSIIVLSIILFISLNPSENGTYVEIYHNNQLIATYPLDENIIINLDIDGEVTIIINAGYVSVAENDCANKICVKTPPIGKSGQKIICAPKKILIIIKNNSSNVYITG